MTSSKPAANTTARLATLETRYGQLHDDVQGLRQDFGTFAQEVRATLTDIRRTPWGDMAKWASVIVATIGLVGGLLISSLNDKINHLIEEQRLRQEHVYSVPLLAERVAGLRDMLSELRSQFRDHERLGFHPEAQAALARLEERVEALQRAQSAR